MPVARRAMVRQAYAHQGKISLCLSSGNICRWTMPPGPLCGARSRALHKTSVTAPAPQIIQRLPFVSAPVAVCVILLHLFILINDFYFSRFFSFVDKTICRWYYIEQKKQGAVEMMKEITIYEIISLVIAGISLLGSALSLWKTRKALYVRIEKHALRTTGLFAVGADGDFCLNPFNCCVSHIIFISVLNPSASPISYFDLEVTDESRKKRFLFPVKAWADTKNLRDLSYNEPWGKFTGRLLVPEETFGVVAPNEYKMMMLAIGNENGDKKYDEAYVSLKLTKRRLFKSRNHSLPERYKTISQKVILP